MNTNILFQSIIARLVRYKAKSFFMMIGIILSVTAIVLVQIIGNSIEQQFRTYISGFYPANTVYLAGGNGFMGGGYGKDNLKVPDIHAVNNSVNGIVASDTIMYAGRRNVTTGSANANVSVIGSSDAHGIARNRPVIDGENFTKEQIRRKARVAIIGTSAAEKLFPGESPIGQIVFLDNVKFDIIGMFRSVGVDPHGADQDNDLHVPYTTLMDRILKQDYVSGVTFVLEDYGSQSVDDFIESVTNVMREEHNIGANEDDDFSIIAPKYMLGMLDDVFYKFDIFVPILTFIVFGIASVVIFNIMLITIRERTAEIGLRKALGAKPSDIRLQLFLETSILSILGTVIGLALSIAILHLLETTLASNFGVKEVAIEQSNLVFGALAAIVASIIGTMLPAKRAAELNPVSALN